MIQKKISSIYLYCQYNDPFIHISIDSQQWTTLGLKQIKPYVWFQTFEYYYQLEFVFCNNNRTQWINPKKQLNEKKYYKQSNFYVQNPGDYIVINNSMSKIEKVFVPQNEFMIISNFQSIICGDDLSLILFNAFWMKFITFIEKYTLVYSTQNTIQSILNRKDIIIPKYVITEAGTCLYRINYNQQYDLVYSCQLKVSQQFFNYIHSLKFFKILLYNSYRINLEISDIDMIQENQNFEQFIKMVKKFGGNVIISPDKGFKLVTIINKSTNVLNTLIELESPYQIISFINNSIDLSTLSQSDKIMVPCNVSNLMKKLIIQYKNVKQCSAQCSDAIVEYLQSQIAYQQSKYDQFQQ